MSWKYELFPHTNLLLMEAFGVLCDDDICAVPTVYRDQRYVPGMNELFVYNRVEEVDVTTSGIERVAALNAQYDDLMNGAKVAWVDPRDYIFGLLRMYEGIRGDAPFHAMVFRNIGDSLEWLELDSETKGALLNRLS